MYCFLFNLLFKNISFIRRCHHCRWKTSVRCVKPKNREVSLSCHADLFMVSSERPLHVTGRPNVSWISTQIEQADVLKSWFWLKNMLWNLETKKKLGLCIFKVSGNLTIYMYMYTNCMVFVLCLIIIWHSQTIHLYKQDKS